MLIIHYTAHMKGKKLYFGFSIVVGILILAIIYDTFSQPGVQDLQGGYKEIAFYRNENNTGPIERVYAVSVKDTLWDEMKKYGQFMPHTEYGNTKVYFFTEGKPAPTTLLPGKDNIPAALQVFCLAKYEKDAMGQISFIKFPFRLP